MRLNWNSHLQEFDLVPYRVATFIDETERARKAVLGKPSPPNPPELLQPTRVKALRPFYVAGRLIEIGDFTTITAADARSLTAIGKCELC